MGVGMLVSRTRVAAVIVRGREVAWEATAVADDVATAVADVLGKLPRQTWWGRVRVKVAVDDPLSAVKTVRGLPPVRSAESLSRVLATAPTRFFVLPGRAAVVTGVRVVAPGVVRAAAFDAQLVDAIRRGAGTARVTVTSIVPAAVAVGALSTREREHPLAAAIGATMLSRREPIAVRAPRRRRRSARVGAARMAAAGIAAMSSAAGAAVLPSHSDVRIVTPSRRAEVQAASAPDVSPMVTDGEDTPATLAVAAAFQHGRTSITLLLDAVSRVLPERTTVTDFRVDGGGVTITALAPRAGDVVRALERIPRISTIELAGPIVRDTSGESEHVTLHFRTAPDPSDLRAAPVMRKPARSGATSTSTTPVERDHRALRSAIVTGRDNAAAATSLAALVSDAADRTGTRIGTLQLGSDFSEASRLFRLTVRSDAATDVGRLAHFFAALESGSVVLAVRELTLTPMPPGATTNSPDAVRADFVLEALATTDPPRTRP